MFVKSVVLAGVAALAAAQAPANESICDYYTTALTKNNTAANQLTVLTLLVNTAVIGSYSPLANASIPVPGILNPNGTYNGTKVNLVPYFSGQFNSTNRNGVRQQRNFLDGGGAAPLKNNMPANDTSSNQYFLLTHLYEFFGLLLGCSQVGQGAYPAYGGNPSMYEVHKFMVLDTAQMNYFIEQVALAGASFGVAASDLQKVGQALNTVFNYRCSPPIALVPGAANSSQSTCTDPSCPTDPKGSCTNFTTYAAPAGASNANSSSGSGGATGTGAGGAGATGTTGGAGSTATTRAGADSLKVGASLAAAFFGLLVYVTMA